MTHIGTHSYMWRDAFICAAWLIHVWDTTHSYVGHNTHLNDSESCCTYEWVILHMWMSHVAHMNGSCCTYEWVVSHVWMSHVAHMNGSGQTYEWVNSHIWMSHITHMNDSCHAYEWVMSHIWMSHVAQINQSCHKWQPIGTNEIWNMCNYHQYWHTHT